MAALIRDAPLGQLIRLLTHNRLLRYPEEMDDFILPDTYKNLDQLPAGEPKTAPSPNLETGTPAEQTDQQGTGTPQEEVEKRSEHSDLDDDGALDVEKGNKLEQAATQQSRTGSSIAPTKTKDGFILVDFYDEGDQENPQNWPFRRKAMATFSLCVYTLAVYTTSSLPIASYQGIQEQFGVSTTELALLLAMYVLMYGWGSLPAASLSEIPSVGRNPPYMVTMGLFVVMSIALPLTNNFAGLVVLRTLQGFFGAPCLATGGASLADMWSFVALPKAILAWAIAATAGPSIGPLVSSYAVAAETWHWAYWEILWLSAPIFIFMFCFLPETFVPNILLRKAQRLRKLTGNDMFRSQSELDQAKTSASAVAKTAFLRPFMVNALDPVVLFTTVYVALIYGTYYSFFESFPIVFGGYHGFDAGSQGLTFLSIAIAVALAAAIYLAYLDYWIAPRMAKFGPGEPEERLSLGLFCSFLLPIGLFIFAWTSSPSIHWVVPLLGIFIFGVGIFILIQLIFAYLPTVYDYRYVASIFAANNAARSSIAFAAILFSTPMFDAIGVSGGVSLLAGLSCLCCVGMVLLRVYGKQMRARSRFTNKYDQPQE